eukprot:5846780-Amphidinium_carterae.2
MVPIGLLRGGGAGVRICGTVAGGGGGMYGATGRACVRYGGSMSGGCLPRFRLGGGCISGGRTSTAGGCGWG